VLSRRYRPWHLVPFSLKYARLRLTRRPVLVNLEVTMRCNASCGFCDYWKTPAEARATERAGFADIARRFQPMIICFSGGEPTLRRDLEQVVADVVAASPYTYTTVLTHGGMLTLDRARALWDAGLDQFNISLDYPDARHDRARGIPGLTRRILDVVPQMVAAGMTVRFTTVIKDDNLDDVVPILHLADGMGAGVNLSVYTALKNGNTAPALGAAHLPRLDALARDILAFKRRRRGVVSSSDWYIRHIPRWVAGAMAAPCRAGETTIHVDPHGRVRRCPDFAPDQAWDTFRPYAPIACDQCFYACRGEAQAPLEPSRFLDLLGSTARPA
jgi:MoaA/NifB/PqqE/SkfB family radical SAM enzyme